MRRPAWGSLVLALAVSVSTEARAQVPTPVPDDAGSVGTTPKLAVYGRVDLVFLWDSNNSPLGRDSELGAFTFRTEDFSVSGSRLGTRFGDARLLGATASGQIEFDLKGGGTRTSPRPRLRLAAVDLTWSDRDLVVSVGQSADVIGQFSADAISFPSESFLGDIGNRRPQIKVAKGLALSSSTKLSLQGSIGIAETTIDDASLPSALQNPSVPIGQARAAVEWKGNAVGDGVIGFWGAGGRKSFDWASTGQTVEMKTWTVGLDVAVPVGRRMSLVGEVWHGITMDLYRYAPSSSALSQTGTIMTGGWGAVTVQPTRRWTLNVGGGFEQPENSGEAPDAYPARSWFGNVYYEATAKVRIGAEVSYWSSDRYRADGVRDKVRVTTEFLYQF